MGRKNKKRELYIFISIIVLLSIILGTCTYLAFGDEIPKNMVSASSPSKVIDKIRETQVKGGKLEISPEELNGTISDILKKPITKKGVTIKGAYFDIKDNSMLIYIPIKYKNLNLLPNIKGNIEYKNDKLIFRISSIKLGKLKLPKGLLMSKLKKYSNEDVFIADDRIEVSKYILPFHAENIYIKDGKIDADIQALSAVVNTSVPAVDIKNGQNNNQSSIQNNKQTSSASNSTAKNSNTVPVISQTGVKSNYSKTLKEISGQLNGVMSSVNTKKEKQIISTIQSVVNKVSNNPNYPYQAEANWVKSTYKKLPTDGRSRVKSAILNNVDITKVLRLINIFGV